MDLHCFRKYCCGFINDIDSKWWRMIIHDKSAVYLDGDECPGWFSYIGLLWGWTSYWNCGPRLSWYERSASLWLTHSLDVLGHYYGHSFMVVEASVRIISYSLSADGPSCFYSVAVEITVECQSLWTLLSGIPTLCDYPFWYFCLDREWF